MHALTLTEYKYWQVDMLDIFNACKNSSWCNWTWEVHSQ